MVQMEVREWRSSNKHLVHRSVAAVREHHPLEFNQLSSYRPHTPTLTSYYNVRFFIWAVLFQLGRWSFPYLQLPFHHINCAAALLLCALWPVLTRPDPGQIHSHKPPAVALACCDFQPAVAASCSTGKYPFSHLLPQVVLSLHPTHISCCWLNTLPPLTLWPTAQIQLMIPGNWVWRNVHVTLSALSLQAGPGFPKALPSPSFSSCWPLFQTPLFYLLGSTLSLPACLAVLSDEDPCVVPGSAAGVSLHPWTQRLPGGVCGLRTAPAAAAAAASLQHHGECVCVCVCVCETVSRRRESLLIRAFAKCLVNSVVCSSVWVQLLRASSSLMEVCLCLWLSD